MLDIAGVLSDFADKVPSLFNGLLKLIYKKDKLSEKIIIDLASHKSAVKAQLLGNSDMSISIRVSNYTPFKLTIENITLKLNWEEASVKIFNGNFKEISSFTEQEFYLNENISAEQAEKLAIASDRNRNTPYLTYDIDTSNRLYRIQKSNAFRDFFLEIINKDNAIKALKKAS